MKKDYANKLIRSSEVVNNLSSLINSELNTGVFNSEPQIIDVPLPTSEYQARPLTSLAPDEQQEAWGEAVANSSNREPTAKEVKADAEAVKVKRGMSQPKLILSHAAQVERARDTHLAYANLQDCLEISANGPFFGC